MSLRVCGDFPLSVAHYRIYLVLSAQHDGLMTSHNLSHGNYDFVTLFDCKMPKLHESW